LRAIGCIRLPFRTWVGWLGARWWPARHFEVLYARTRDPWCCNTSAYESLKRERTLAAVLEGTRGPVLELGCGEGLLTAMLGDRNWPVTAVDISATAVERARRRCASFTSVRVISADARELLPPGPFGTVVMGEVLYYLGRGRSRRTVCARIKNALQEGGRIVVIDPWPASRAIQKALRTNLALRLVREDVHLDRGRSYAVTIYERR